MKTGLFRVCTLATFFSLASSIVIAQTRIHAVSGTVISINPRISMIEVETDDGSSGHFRWTRKADVAIDFDKNVSADAIAADKFTTKGAHVIVYYFGDGDLRTIVALHDLGDGSLEKSTGTVVKLSRKERLLTIKSTTGQEVSFHLDPKTVADTATGVMQGFKFDFSKGDQVRVTAAQVNGSATALLIAPAIM